MRFSIRFADKIVGALLLLALATLVVVVFMIGKSQRLFARDYQYKTYYSSASGLSVNMPVQYMGVTIGHIKKIFLVTDEKDKNKDRVEILFTIFEEHNHRVRDGSMVEVQISPIGLGNKFVFYSGNGDEIKREGQEVPEIPEYSSPLAKSNIASGLVGRPDTAGDSIGNILFQVNEILNKINSAVTGSQTEGATKIDQIMVNIEMLTHDLSRQLNPIMNNLDTVTGRMSDPSGAVMSILDSEGSVYSDLSSSLDSLTGILDNLDKTSEFIPSNLPGLLIDLNTALRKVQDVATAMSNNPLLRGGIPERRETSPGGAGSRNQEF